MLAEYVRQYKVIIENKLILNFVLTRILILNDSPIEIEKKKSILKSNLHWIMLMIQLSKYLLSPFLNTPNLTSRLGKGREVEFPLYSWLTISMNFMHKSQYNNINPNTILTFPLIRYALEVLNQEQQITLLALQTIFWPDNRRLKWCSCCELIFKTFLMKK